MKREWSWLLLWWTPEIQLTWAHRTSLCLQLLPSPPALHLVPAILLSPLNTWVPWKISKWLFLMEEWIFLQSSQWELSADPEVLGFSQFSCWLLFSKGPLQGTSREHPGTQQQSHDTGVPAIMLFWNFVYKIFSKLLLGKKTMVRVAHPDVNCGNQYRGVCWLEEEPPKPHQCWECPESWPRWDWASDQVFGRHR